MASVLRLLGRELGLHHMRDSHSPRDVALLVVSRFVRLAGFGAVAPILLLFLRDTGFSERSIGGFLSATLLGDVALSLLVTWSADLLGRRRMLAIGSALMLASGVAFYFSDEYFVLLGAAIFGIISPSGNETGPFSALEQAILSQLTEPEGRVSLLMWYAVIGYAGMGVGNLATSFVVSSFDQAGKSDLAAYRVIFLIYGAIAAFKVALSFALSAKCEVDAPTPPNSAPSSANEGERQPLINSRQPPADATVQIPAPLAVGRLMTLCLIFSLDSFASSLGTGSFIAYFLRTTFAAPIALIAQVMSVTAVTTCLSQLAAGSLAKRLGVIYTMVCTHVPAQIFTILFGLAPTLPLALTLLIARSCLTSMDSSVRGAFLAAVIPKESRTRFLGIINVCKTLASTPGPTLSLALVSLGSSRIVFVLMGSIKILYNVILLVLFKTAPLQH